MKKLTKLFSTICLVIALIVIVSLIGCENRKYEPEQKPTEDEEIKTQLAIIKLSPEIKDRVFVTPIVDSCIVDYSKNNLNTLYYGKWLVLCNPTKQDSLLAEFAQVQLNISRTSPYVILDNGYAIIDWKWSHLHPLSGYFRSVLFSSSKIYDNKMARETYSTNFYYLNGTLENEEYYLLSLKWQELTDLTEIWPLQKGQLIAIPEVRYINLMDIEKYGDYQESFQNNFEENYLLRMYIQYSQNPESLATSIEKYNRCQSSYVETLNQMIRNNDLDKWTHNYR